MAADRWQDRRDEPQPRRGSVGMWSAYLLLLIVIGACALAVLGQQRARQAPPVPAATIALPKVDIALPKPPPAVPADPPPQAVAPKNPPPADTADEAPKPRPQPVSAPVYSVRGPNYPPPPPPKPNPASALVAPPPADGAPAQPPAARPAPVTSLGGMPEPSQAGITEPSPYGPMPRISPEGRMPFIVNAQRFDHTNTSRPRVAVALMGLGNNATLTEAAIASLPPEITLIFDPYAPDVEMWMRKARAAGHEVLIALPLEADANVKADLGKRVLTSKLSPAELTDRLHWVLSRATVIAGVATWEGGAFFNSPAHFKPVLDELARRGLLVFDTRMARPNVVQENSGLIGLPFARSLGFFDETQDKETIDANLALMEDRARKSKFAVAIGSPFPLTVDRLAHWARGLGERGFALAPITGVTECADICSGRVRKHMAADGLIQQ